MITQTDFLRTAFSIARDVDTAAIADQVVDQPNRGEAIRQAIHAARVEAVQKLLNAMAANTKPQLSVMSSSVSQALTHW